MYCREERGFTLIEMIVVLVILGLVLGLVITRGPVRSGRLDLDGTVQQVAGVLRLARSRAIAEERAVTVFFGPGIYALDRATPTALSSDVLLMGDRAIRFTPDGGSSGGQVDFRSGDRQIAISVDWLTGRVRLSGN